MRVDQSAGALPLEVQIDHRPKCVHEGRPSQRLVPDALDPLDRFAFPLERRTPHTLVTRAQLQTELEATRERGYGVDDEENEVGVSCLAIPVRLGGASVASGAISISAVTFRTPLQALVDAVPEIRGIIAAHLGPGALA